MALTYTVPILVGPMLTNPVFSSSSTSTSTSTFNQRASSLGSLLYAALFFSSHPSTVHALELAQIEPSKIDQLLSLSIAELLNVEVTTASLRPEKASEAPASMLVVTRSMIERRGYRTFFDVARDLPQFDLLDTDTGGQAAHTRTSFRGLSDNTQRKLLVLVDGVPQNNINALGSTNWSYESMLPDLDRIEIIQGPGSVLYGAQAYAGVIHFITRDQFKGVQIRPYYGSHHSRGFDLYVGHTHSNDLEYSFSFLSHETEGDDGDRYDPGRFWHGLRDYATLSFDYDAEGNFSTLVPNPSAGAFLGEGFETWQNTISSRGKVRWKRWLLSGYYWSTKEGLGPAAPGYRALTRSPDYERSLSGYYLSLDHRWSPANNLSLNSRAVYRVTDNPRLTSMDELYRFRGETFIVSQYGEQYYIEEQLDVQIDEHQHILFGLKGARSVKAPVLQTLGGEYERYSTTSSFLIAASGGGLDQPQKVDKFYIDERALYALWNKRLNEALLLSLGQRYDHSDDYGSVTNPRASVIYRPFGDRLSVKLLYGTAFREPGYTEITGSPIQNPHLKPEDISTYELDVSSQYRSDLFLRGSLFYSKADNLIVLSPNADAPLGIRFENALSKRYRGINWEAEYQPIDTVSISMNYAYLEDQDEGGGWGPADQTARHKLNLILNWLVPEYSLGINIRTNLVGKRKALKTNRWMQHHNEGYAPGYGLTNITLTYTGMDQFSTQLIIKNLFDKPYYHLGQAPSSGNVDLYDWETSTNAIPIGLQSSHMPQEGRTVLLRVEVKYD